MTVKGWREKKEGGPSHRSRFNDDIRTVLNL